MKTGDLRNMSDEQLALTLGETEKHLFQLRFQSATDRLETPSEIRKAKRAIARIKTLQRQRQLVAFGKVPDAELTAQLAGLQAKIEGPGKRRFKRAIVRIETIQHERAAQKGSGK